MSASGFFPSAGRVVKQPGIQNYFVIACLERKRVNDEVRAFIIAKAGHVKGQTHDLVAERDAQLHISFEDAHAVDGEDCLILEFRDFRRQILSGKSQHVDRSCTPVLVLAVAFELKIVAAGIDNRPFGVTYDIVQMTARTYLRARDWRRDDNAHRHRDKY